MSLETMEYMFSLFYFCLSALLLKARENFDLIDRSHNIRICVSKGKSVFMWGAERYSLKGNAEFTFATNGMGKYNNDDLTGKST